MSGPGRHRGTEPSRRVPVLGVVGGIGSGKSTVAALLEEMGAARVDADRMAHRALRDPGVRDRIRRRWGPEVFTPRGNVSRKALGRRVFRNPGELRALERILHPRIRAEIANEVRRLRGRRGVRAIVLDAPLLLEAGLERLCDRILFVATSRATRFERLKSKRKWTLEEIKRRQDFQKPLKEKRRRADITIDNDRSIRATRKQLAAIWDEIVGPEDPRS
jgi:dephospho-CoA kinase